MRKTIILLSVLMCCSLLLSAQEFAPIGAKWHYDYNGYGFSGYVVVECLKDTVLQGKKYKEIQESFFIYNFPDYRLDTFVVKDKFIHQSGDSIYQYYGGSLYFMYDFVAQEQDIWNVDDPYYACFDGSVLVDSISGYTINNMGNDTVLTSFFVSPTEDSPVGFGFSSSSMILKNIGNTNGYLFPTPTKSCSVFDIPYSTHLRCYEDSLNFYHITLSEDCKKIENYTATDVIPYVDLAYYPNPINEVLNIFAPVAVDISICNLEGKIVLQSNLLIGQNRMDLSHLKPGLYLLTLSDKKGILSNKKIVKF